MDDKLRGIFALFMLITVLGLLVTVIRLGDISETLKEYRPKVTTIINKTYAPKAEWMAVDAETVNFCPGEEVK